MPTMGLLRWIAPGRTVEVGIAKGEDATVRGH